ncbi:hypothetical protein Taro_026166 [Colocasia esculenta]|uniref:Uncharacterized protein n=1 Tax=Colocasia esculenta TaxID=4460 RepID=A0A843VAQ2_COLES|nr:hypothetical protein [Colocasia esculenta]
MLSCQEVQQPEHEMVLRPLLEEVGYHHAIVINCDDQTATLRPQMWEIFHKLRMDYNNYSAVAAPLRLTPVLETLGTEAPFEIMRAWKPGFEIVRT